MPVEPIMCVCVCVCVIEGGRKSESERACVSVYVCKRQIYHENSETNRRRWREEKGRNEGKETDFVGGDKKSKRGREGGRAETERE